MGPNLYTQYHVGSIDVSGVNAIYLRTLLPMRLHAWGFNVTTVIAAAAPTITCDIVEVDTTAADPTASANCGTCLATSSTMALNTGVIYDVNLNKGTRIIYSGEAFKFYGNSTGTGVVQVYAVCELLGMVDVDQRGHVTSHPGSTTRPTAMAQVTRVTA